MKIASLACGLLIASGSLFAQQYTMTTLAGTGTAGWSGDNGPALSAQFTQPIRVALDSNGNVFVTDLGNSSIREIFTNGTINSVTGNGSPGFSGDGSTAIGAQLASPHDIALDSNNNLYIADTGNTRIRIVSQGRINTFAGSTRGTAGGNLGDNGPALSAQFIAPTGVAVDKSGNVYVSDIGNATVRKIAPNGIITTIAGSGFLAFGAFTGEGGPATQALLGTPYSLTLDSAGNLYIIDTGLSRLFRIDSDGTIHTVVANFPAQNCTIDSAGDIYVPDTDNDIVDKILPAGTDLWIGGDGVSGYAGDNAIATTGNMGDPYGVAVDGSGKVYVAEGLNAVVRTLTPVANSIGAIASAASIEPFAAPPSGVGDATVPITAGEIVVLFGTGMGPATLVSNTPTNGVFGTSLAGTTVSIGGHPAPIIYTSSTLVSAIVPYEISGMTSAVVTVSYQGKTTASYTAPVAATSPAVFTLNASGSGEGLAVAVKNSQVNSASNPAAVGDFLLLYETGEGQTTPAGVDGKLAVSPYPSPLSTVSATVNGVSAVVGYAGAAPGFVAGVMQINLQIPTGVVSGTAEVKVTVGTVTSPPVTVVIQ
jgi:uncharacterized protein (TIGR03437 family)